MIYPGTNIVGKYNPVHVTGNYTAKTGAIVFAVVPDPTATVKAVAYNTSDVSMSSDGTSSGSGVAKVSAFYGVYSSVAVTAGSVDVYERDL